MNLERRLEIAAAALNKLEDEHTAFIRSVAALKQPALPGAELRVGQEELHATCLGVSLTTKHRPIAKNGELKLLEYAFAARHGEKQLLIWRMFLSEGHLYADLACTDLICQASNGYLVSRVAPRLGSALLQSDVFAPGNDG